MFKILIGAGIAGFLSACVAEKINKEKTAKFSSIAGPAGLVSLAIGVIGQLCQR